jgi:hypothetical protein
MKTWGAAKFLIHPPSYSSSEQFFSHKIFMIAQFLARLKNERLPNKDTEALQMNAC